MADVELHLDADHADYLVRAIDGVLDQRGGWMWAGFVGEGFAVLGGIRRSPPYPTGARAPSLNLSDARLRLATLRTYGGTPPVCACCGESDESFLTIDHIDGGGNEERREWGNRGGMTFYRQLRQRGWPSGYRVLCFNCNHAVHIHGVCPHGAIRKSTPTVSSRHPSLFGVDGGCVMDPSHSGFQPPAGSDVTVSEADYLAFGSD